MSEIKKGVNTMDLEAYCNIEDLNEIAKKNNIYVPRLRGYRLMKNEEAYGHEHFTTAIKHHVFSDALTSCPPFNPDSHCFEYSERTDKRLKKYGIFEKDENSPFGKYSQYNLIDIKWNLIHGKARKRIKFALKKRTKGCWKQYDTWNKYCGRADVLYIHARIGGNNWNYYEGYKLEKEPWFLEKVDDYYDSTYCDIYARIK